MPAIGTLTVSGCVRAKIATRLSALSTVANSRASWWILFAGMSAALVAPLFVVDIPPLTDYPNHLAREFIIASGQSDPVLSAMYAVRWGIIPNLAIDIVLPVMAKVIPLYIAGRILLGFALLLPVIGATIYHRSVFGERLLWPLASGLVAYNAIFLAGFLNFQISLGLALLGAAGWVTWRDRRPAMVTILGAFWCVVVFFSHVFGLLFLTAITLGWEIARFSRLRRDNAPSGKEAVHVCLRLALVYSPALALCLASPIGTSGGEIVWRSLPEKLFLLLMPFLSYSGIDSGLVGISFFLILGLLIGAGRFSIAPGIIWTVPGLCVAYAAMPGTMHNTGFISERFPIMVVLMLFAGGRPKNLIFPVGLVLAVAIAVAFITRTADIASVWNEHNADLTELRSVIAPVLPRSRVLVVSVEQDDNPDYWSIMRRGRWVPGLFRTDVHMPALLVLEQRAFWPQLFTARGKQPIALIAPLDRLDGPDGVLPNYHVLEHPAEAAETSARPYLANWVTDFDYVLLLNAGGAGNLDRYVPDHLQLLARADVAALFRITGKQH